MKVTEEDVEEAGGKDTLGRWLEAAVLILRLTSHSGKQLSVLSLLILSLLIASPLFLPHHFQFPSIFPSTCLSPSLLFNPRFSLYSLLFHHSVKYRFSKSSLVYLMINIIPSAGASTLSNTHTGYFPPGICRCAINFHFLKTHPTLHPTEILSENSDPQWSLPNINNLPYPGLLAYLRYLCAKIKSRPMGDTVDIKHILELGCLSISTSSNLTPLLLFSFLDIFFWRWLLVFCSQRAKLINSSAVQLSWNIIMIFKY